MPLQPPQLDTLTYDQIRQRALLRIPRYTPEWTDFNESDPGATLVELFAWLTEMMGYQMNRIPERNYLKFLQLMGLELRPAQPAVVHLTFTPAPNADTRSVPRGARVSAQPAGGGLPVIFETIDGLDLIRLPLTRVLVLDGGSFSDVTAINTAPGKASYRPLGWVPQVGNALYLGFADPQNKGQKPLFPQEMRFRVFLPAGAQAGQPDACLDANAAITAPVTLVWEYRQAGTPPRWSRLNVYKDASAGLTREGEVQVQGPSDDFVPTVEGTVQEELYWLRVRLSEGAYPAGKAPVIDFIRPNVVSAENLSTVQQELLGESRGAPGQTFTLQHTPVKASTLNLVVIDPGQDQVEWNQKQDFLASQADSPDYVLNATTGEIRFGDGQKGLIPVAKAQIVATTYRYGGGTAGNVAAGLATGLMTKVQGVASVTNERPAVGGRDEQSMDEFKSLAPDILRHRNQAISADDYSRLAAEAGGIARAIALPLTHPDYEGVKVPGAVTIVVVPDNDELQPTPSQDQLEAVCAYLNDRRLLTTEMYVRAPKFHPVKVLARVQAQPYAAFDDVSRQINAAINAYLNPLGRKPQGAETNWQSGSGFGRALFPTSLYNIILDVTDVEAVVNLALEVDGVPWDSLKTQVDVEPWGMVCGVAKHDIVVEPYKAG